MKNKKDFPLIIALSIPALTFAWIVLNTYLPILFVHPHTNFLFFRGNENSIDKYSFQGGQLVEQYRKYPNGDYQYYEPKIFIHDVKRNKTREIFIEEARRLNLNNQRKSPDGFEVAYGSGFYESPFFSGQEGQYLKKQNYAQKLNIDQKGISNRDVYRDFRFLGWIMGE